VSLVDTGVDFSIVQDVHQLWDLFARPFVFGIVLDRSRPSRSQIPSSALFVMLGQSDDRNSGCWPRGPADQDLSNCRVRDVKATFDRSILDTLPEYCSS
jgi:hypothetical protein